MIERAASKVAAAGLAESVRTRCVALETIEELAGSGERFDGAFSNFAALNCVKDLSPIARGLARVLPEGAHALLVIFGPFAPGEVAVQLVRGNMRAAFRRMSRGAVPARLGGQQFTVWYPSPREAARAFAPWFRLRSTRGIGVFVPPSAAEPGISGFPRVLGLLEAMDRVVARPLAWLGDHVLLDFVRRAASSGGESAE
jgi:hypothetical protein